MEIGNVSEKEFSLMIVKMMQDLKKKKKITAQTEKIQEMFTKELEDLKNEKNRAGQYNNRNEKYTRRNQ